MNKNIYFKKGVILSLATTFMLMFIVYFSSMPLVDRSAVYNSSSIRVGIMGLMGWGGKISYPLLIFILYTFLIQVGFLIWGMIKFVKPSISDTRIKIITIPLIIYFGIKFLDGVFAIFQQNNLESLTYIFYTVMLVIFQLFYSGKIKNKTTCYVSIGIIAVIPIILNIIIGNNVENQFLISLFAKHLSLPISLILFIYSVTDKYIETGYPIIRKYKNNLIYSVLFLIAYLIIQGISYIPYFSKYPQYIDEIFVNDIIVLTLTALTFAIIMFLYSFPNNYKPTKNKLISFLSFKLIVFSTAFVLTVISVMLPFNKNYFIMNFRGVIIFSLVAVVVAILSAVLKVSDNKLSNDEQKACLMEADFITKFKRVYIISLVLNTVVCAVLQDSEIIGIFREILKLGAN